MAESVAKEFRERLHFNLVDTRKVEPLRTTWNDECLPLVLLLDLSVSVELLEHQDFFSILVLRTCLINFYLLLILHHLLGVLLGCNHKTLLSIFALILAL